MTIWTEASAEVLAIAQKMIDAWHPDLQEASIGFLFRDKAGVGNRRKIIGHTQKVSPSLRPFLDYDFLIWISEDDWKNMQVERREALIDHQLCHCRKTAEGRCELRGHDVEEFHVIISRHGFWTDDLMGLEEQVRQSTMPIEDQPEGNVQAIDPEKLEKAAGIIKQALEIVEKERVGF